MQSFLIALIACAGLGLISANIPASVIEADLAEITQLTQGFRRLTPAAGRQFNDASCQMITECCPQLRSNFASLSLSGKTDQVLEQCFGKKDSSAFMSKLMACKPFQTLGTLSKDPQFTKYATVVSKKATQNKEDMQLTLAACSQDEIYSIACEWNRVDLQNSCQRKVLQNLAQQGDQAYTNKVQQTKSGYAQLTSELKNLS